MKKEMIAACLVLVCSLVGTSAMAADANSTESIKDRFGITGEIGFLVPADSDAVGTGFVIGRGHTDTGFVGGGGLIYGILNNYAAEFEVTHTGFGTDAGTDFDTTNISLGAQYRYLNLPVKKLVPYAGFGLDILVNGANNGLDVDTVAGVHVKAGADYFLLRQLALTSEIKGVIAPNADIKAGGAKVGEFDPDSFSMTFGVRYFFN
ncbi:outer membrane beta-barrel protein [Geobacter sp. AOG2]|uniref:outer membrane beta-barrel protein n=1 Tax=Geobacter sp. AOG2 TaxID=1566347 RepID=UPI001CC7D7C2|nr:outer membrane beta-barrel protein [Geobacter sp. AOG2]GFE62833.1 outer membrane protein [Geobacter sp. AOG2]